MLICSRHGLGTDRPNVAGAYSAAEGLGGRHVSNIRGKQLPVTQAEGLTRRGSLARQIVVTIIIII